MQRSVFVLMLALTMSGCNSQDAPTGTQTNIGGPCEGCEAIFEFGERHLSPTDTLPGYHQNETRIKVTGTVFQNDGKTPASDVIVYAYQTNREGIYKKNENSKGWELRHGIHRGWVKTKDDGRYTFYTFRPASYPGRTEPEHIHLTIKEPGKNEYYIDDVLFDDDSLLTEEKRIRLKSRAGSGIVKLQKENGHYIANRNIILGLNIPDYK